LVWWSGLSTADARRSLEMNKAKSQKVDGVTYWTVGPEPKAARRPETTVHLLPVYDEYLVAYRDQSAVPRAAYVMGSFQHALVIGGQVAGSWKPRLEKDRLVVEVSPDRRLTAVERRAVAEAVTRYRDFYDW
jgi:hypothetical protein